MGGRVESHWVFFVFCLFVIMCVGVALALGLGLGLPNPPLLINNHPPIPTGRHNPPAKPAPANAVHSALVTLRQHGVQDPVLALVRRGGLDDRGVLSAVACGVVIVGGGAGARSSAPDADGEVVGAGDQSGAGGAEAGEVGLAAAGEGGGLLLGLLLLLLLRLD